MELVDWAAGSPCWKIQYGASESPIAIVQDDEWHGALNLASSIIIQMDTRNFPRHRLGDSAP